LVHALNTGSSSSAQDTTFALKFKCFGVEFEKESNFDRPTKKIIEEDLKRYKREITDKHESQCFWVNWGEFRDYFDRLYVSHHNESIFKKKLKFDVKGYTYFGCRLTIKSAQTRCFLELEQEDKIFHDKSYDYSNIRIYILSIRVSKGRGKFPHN
jgi:hypothetical protein